MFESLGCCVERGHGCLLVDGAEFNDCRLQVCESCDGRKSPSSQHREKVAAVRAKRPWVKRHAAQQQLLRGDAIPQLATAENEPAQTALRANSTVSESASSLFTSPQKHTAASARETDERPRRRTVSVLAS